MKIKEILSRILPVKNRYYSQYGQDKFIIEQLFKRKEEGFFVDIGAHDGITLSNTKVLEEMGWSGVCIEPNPSVFAQLIQNRKCTCHNIALGSPKGQAAFLVVTGYAEMLSGLYDQYDPRHLDRVYHEIAEHGGTATTINIDVVPFGDIVNTDYVDYMSLDVEGGELSVLKTIDFDKYHIQCITLENNFKDPKLDQFLLDRGYDMIANLECDSVFWKK